MSKPTEITVTVQLALKYDRVRSLLISGVEQGIGYWAADVVADPPYPSGELNFYNLPATPGYAWLIREVEPVDAVPHRLDLQALQRGLVVMAEKYPHHFADFLKDRDDADTGDVLIQCCVFGELVYG